MTMTGYISRHDPVMWAVSSVSSFNLAFYVRGALTVGLFMPSSCMSRCPVLVYGALVSFAVRNWHAMNIRLLDALLLRKALFFFDC
jgi:hypothetical protein